jgi:hypothetical protein
VAANAQGIAYSFKNEILQAIHNLGITVTRISTGADTLNAALYAQNQSIGPGTAAYSPVGEVSGTNYTAGGQVVTNGNPPTTAGGATAYWTPSASITWTTVTLPVLFDTVLLYNVTQGNRAIGAFTFGAQTVTSGNFTLTMPANGPTTALVQLT